MVDENELLNSVLEGYEMGGRGSVLGVWGRGPWGSLCGKPQFSVVATEWQRWPSISFSLTASLPSFLPLHIHSFSNYLLTYPIPRPRDAVVIRNGSGSSMVFTAQQERPLLTTKQIYKIIANCGQCNEGIKKELS